MGWGRVYFFFGLTAALLVLSSCGSSTSTTTTPTITISCTPADVTVLGTSQCTATVLNLSSTLVNWTISPTGTGSISAGGLYTAPAAVPTNNVVTVTATSQVQSTLTATQNLTLVQPTAIATVTCVDPSTNLAASTVSSGNSLACSATAATGAFVPVNWTVANTNNAADTTNLGTISTQGNYKAPLVPPTGQSITITATSKALATDTKTVTATVVFGSNVLSGSYVFSTIGRLPTHALWARAGSFTVGGGALTGIEDTNQGGSPNVVTTQRTFTGSYSVGPDGRGIMQLCEGSGGAACPLGSPATAYFNLVITSPNQVQLIEFSSPIAASATVTASGEMISQDPSVISNGDGNLSGTYSFNFAGVSSSAAEHSIVGEFTANGHGTISAGSTVAPLVPGEWDIDDSTAPTTLPGSTYLFSSNGRGTATLGGLTFAVYPVSVSRAIFIEIDPVPPSTATSAILLGNAYLQQTSSTCGWGMNSLSGTAVFETTGTVTAGASSGFIISDVGSFNADGTAGTVTSASIDENSGGTVSSSVGTLAGTYTMDPCGRGTLAIGAHTYVFYIISGSNAVLQETTAVNGVIGHGLLVPANGGTFANSTLTGSYAFRAGGTNAAGTAGEVEYFVAQFTSAGTGSGLAGSLDLNNFGATQTGVAISNGTYLLAGGLRATLALPLQTAPSPTTRNFVLYMVSPTLFYALDTDASPAGTALGVITNQF